MHNENVIRAIIGIMAVDNDVNAAEEQFLTETCTKLGVAQGIVQQILNDVRQGKSQMHLPRQPEEQKSILESLIRAAVADGEVSSRERNILDLVAGKIGVSQTSLEDSIQSWLQKALVSSPENTPDVEMMVCPKCQFNQVAGESECFRCGVIFAKIGMTALAGAVVGGETDNSADTSEEQNDLESICGFIISQQKEWGEILTGFETLNRYVVSDQRNSELFHAEERGGSFILRQFLRAWRPFEVFVNKQDGQSMLHIKRPFRFYFHEIKIYGQGGLLLGRVKREFSFLRRIYSVFDANDKQIFQLFGPILHPWTFEILEHDTEIGKITKKWSGLLQEGFTDADNFGVSFSFNLPVNQKAILLGAVFLIDFVHFEENNRN